MAEAAGGPLPARDGLAATLLTAALGSAALVSLWVISHRPGHQTTDRTIDGRDEPAPTAPR